MTLEEVPTKKLRLTKPSKSAALHIDLCKASNPTDALQYLLSFARKPVEAESVEGVVRILLEHYYKVSETETSHANTCFLILILNIYHPHLKKKKRHLHIPVYVFIISKMSYYI